MNRTGEPRWSAPDVVLLVTLVVAICAGAAVAVSERSAAQIEDSRDVLRALGGLGAGRAVDLSRCAAAFDPRLASACDLRYQPLPGADALCPDHALAPLQETR